ncbi:hypothetical protein KL943_005160 [Ogataea angusta]|nr:hypothetical protein KL943_005160 [Ogataea angusta]
MYRATLGARHPNSSPLRSGAWLYLSTVECSTGSRMDPNPSNRKLARNSDGDPAQIISSRPTMSMKTASSRANLSVASITVVSLRK